MSAVPLAARLAELEQRGLLRTRNALAGPQGARVIVDGHEYLSFCSNDYLGLASHPDVVSAARLGAERYGVGAGASHLVSGHSVAHGELEAALARFVNLPRALYFSSGYMANLAVASALLGRGDWMLCDKLNHASLNDAAILARAKMRRYPHRDLAMLERMLAGCDRGRKLVATDAVFSMDGDIAPLPQLLALCERYDAWLLVDDAHGFGVLGNGGRGALAHFGLAADRIIYMGTLGKAAGVCGAFVAGGDDVIETLLQRARTYIYTTASPPLLAHALLASLRIIERDEWRRQRLGALALRLKQGLKLRRLRLLPSTTPIQPIVAGENETALRVARLLKQAGVLVPAIRPPTVPRGQARLRVSLCANHDEADVDQLVAALAACE